MTGQYTRHRYYSDLRGIDLSSSPAEISRGHFCDLENMWHDPVCADSLLTETFPGYRIFARLPSPIYGIYTQRLPERRYLVVHAQDKLYRFESELCNHPKSMATLAPIREGIPCEKGCAFFSGSSLYLLKGGEYYRVSAEGEVFTAGEESAYLPTTFYNGEPYEQRNLLTDAVIHRFTADGDFSSDSDPSEGLLYRVVDEELAECLVTGCERRDAVHIKIPASAIIDGKEYTVVGIAASAFSDLRTLVRVELPASLLLIGARAFWGCTALLSLTLPSSIKQLGSAAFGGCLSLKRVHVSAALGSYESDVFTLCPSLKDATLGMNEDDYLTMTDRLGTLFPTETALSFETEAPNDYAAGLFRYPIRDPALSVRGVFLDDHPLQTDFTPYKDGFLLYRTVKEGDFITHVELLVSDRYLLTDRVLRVELSLSPSHFTSKRPYAAFGEGFSEVTGREAVKGCRMAAFFDGRFFLTGNPALPNTVFHTLPDNTGRNNPFYIGVLSYFNDGEASLPNRAILSTGSALIVFKEDESGEGAIYYHTPADTGEALIPRIYPVESATAGVGAIGCAVSYKDDPVFLAKDGLLGIEKKGLSLERGLSVRSHRINARLLREDLKAASMAVHEGLLYLLTDGRIYLADARLATYHKDGSSGYEWYFLSGIGSYTADRPLYRTCAFLPDGAEKEGITLAPVSDVAADGEIYSVRLDSGVTVYYEKRANGEKLAVDSDGERTGGVFSPARELCSDGERLFFGTEDGSLGVFNTDKRGKRLYRLSPTPLFAKKGESYLASETGKAAPVSEECLETLGLYRREGDLFYYEKDALVYTDGEHFSIAEPLGERVRPTEIHRYFYTYGSHAYLASCTLAPDEGGLPHYTKDTLPRSAAVKVKTPRGGAFSVLVRTDRSPWRVCESLTAGSADFGDFDFSLLDFHAEDAATIPLREKEKRWCFKQYRFASEGTKRPFGLYALAYSYRPSGTLKE